MGLGEETKRDYSIFANVPLEWQGNDLVSLPYSHSLVGCSGYLPEAGHYVCLQ